MKQQQKQRQFTPHELDFLLIEEFSSYINNTTLPKEKIREYKQLKEEYIIACRLNKGPDLDRSIYWARKAREANRKIRRILDYD